MAANPSIQLGTDGNWAIKEDNLLAYKKDGTRFFNKEFDFTRGSLATFVDKDGLIKVSGVTDTELVTNGDFATDSDWIKGNGATISNGKGNIIGDGTSFTYLEQSNVFTVGKFYKVSLDAVINSGLGLKVQDGSTNENFGAITTSGTYTFYGEANNSSLVIGRRTGGTAFDSYVDNVSVKEIQLDVPRIDFTNDTKGHLLLEPQSTNLITQSENFTSGWASTGVTIVSNSTTSPSGNSDATLLKGSTNSSRHNVVRAGLSASNTAALSLFAKAKELRYLQIASANTANQYVNFDLQDGLIGTVGSSFSNAKIENYGNGWYKLSVVSENQYNSFYISLISGTNATWLESWAMSNNTDGLFIYGSQLEALSFPTSYIPTFGSISTRNGEVCNNSGSAQDFNDSEGVLYAEVARFNNDLTYSTIGITDGSDNNVIAFKFRNTANDVWSAVTGSGAPTSARTTISDISKYNKFAASYSTVNNTSKFYINGVEVGNVSLSGINITGLNELQFLQNTFENFYGKTKNLKVFKRAMSDGELYLLTVTQYQSYQEMATALNYTL